MTQETQPSSNLYREEPIKSEQEDRFRRLVYARVIADTITSSEGGFNFGISGEWGSGKSSVLNLIEPLVREKSFLVVRFNPWKVATERLSIRRKFLIDVVKDLKEQQIEVSLPDRFRSSITKISKLSLKEKLALLLSGVLSFFLVFFLLGLLPLAALLFLDPFFLSIGWPSLYSFYLNNLFVPLLGALAYAARHFLGKLAIERTDPEIQTAEEFEALFLDIIDVTREQQDGRLRLVIFIDDLDRGTPADVMAIFSSIMTFFERTGITFVIAADQKMVERIITEQLGVGGLEGARREAKEFVKKVFQVNWIIPPIPMHLRREFVQENFPDIVVTGDDGVRIAADELATEWIVDLVTNEFGGNPRKVRYFMRELEFQLRAVDAMIKDRERSPESETREIELDNLRNIRNHPELLAKILIIRSSYPEQWTRIQERPRIIVEAEKGEDTEFERPLLAFLTAKPRFADWDLSPEYYVFFSGITGFEEQELLDPSYFVQYAKAGNLEKARAMMEGATDIHRIRHLDTLLGVLETTDDEQETANCSRIFCQTVSVIEDPDGRRREHLRFLRSIEELEERAEIVLNSLQEDDFGEFVRSFDETQPSVEQARKMLSKEPFTSPQVRPKVWSGFAEACSSVGPGISTVFASRMLEDLANGDESLQNEIFARMIQAGEGLVQAENFEEFMDAVIEVVTQRDVRDEKVLSALAEIRSSLLEEQRSKLTEHYEDGVTGSIHDILFVIQHLITIASMTLPSRIVDSIVTESLNRQMGERIQIISQLAPHQDSLNKDHRWRLFSGLLNVMMGDDASESRAAMQAIKANPWLFPDDLRSTGPMLRRMLGAVTFSPLPLEVLRTFYDLRDVWRKSVPISSEFINQLKLLRKHENEALSQEASRILEEIKAE